MVVSARVSRYRFGLTKLSYLIVFKPLSPIQQRGPVLSRIPKVLSA
jgi:hypothetical protein